VNNDVSKINYLAVIVAVVAAAVVSNGWYSSFLFGKKWMALRALNAVALADTKVPGWKVSVELVREFVVAYVLARFVNRLGITDWKGALRLGFWVWLGFPVAMLVGASLWDNKPWMLVPIHAGDWFMKMLLMAVILGTWRRIWARNSQ